MSEDHVCPVHGIEEHSVMEYGLVPRDIAMFSVRINRHFCSIDVGSARSFYSPLVDEEDPILQDRFEEALAACRVLRGMAE